MNRDIQKAIHNLNQLSQKLDNYKSLVDQNAAIAEVNILAHFKNLNDQLSARQGFLLSQLSDVYKNKCDSILNYQQNINTLLMALSVHITVNMDSKISECIKNTESLISTHNLNPFITFKADNSLIKEFISNYGRLSTVYSGHFADPCKPSKCLPHALEEEDEQQANDETFNPDAMSCSNKSCTCIDQKLRKWLHDSNHRCNMANNDDKKVMQFTRRFERNQDPFSDGCKTSECSSISRLTTTEHTCQDYSDSFDILTSSNVSSNLKEWLFCDNIELDNMPGLFININHNSNRNQTCGKKSNPTPMTPADRNTNSVSDCLKPWLLLDSDTSQLCPKIARVCSNDSVSPSSVACCPKKSNQNQSVTPISLDPLDLNKWLAKEETCVPLCDSNRSRDRSELITTKSDKNMVETMHHATDAAPSSTSEQSMCDSITRCPVYGHCLGGPGGPTCCGALADKPCRTVLSKMVCGKGEPQQHTTMEDCDQSNEDGKMPQQQSFSPVSADPDYQMMMNKKSSNLLVEQLNQIATSDLKQWIADPEIKSSSDVILNNSNRVIQEWLCNSSFAAPTKNMLCDEGVHDEDIDDDDDDGDVPNGDYICRPLKNLDSVLQIK